MLYEVVLCMSLYQPVQATSCRPRTASPQPLNRACALQHTVKTPRAALMTVPQAT